MLIDTPIPNKVYHITQSKYVNAILSEGLVPGSGFTASFEFEDNHDRVFITTDYDTLITMDDSFDRESGKYSLLEVDVESIKGELVPDDAYDNSYLEDDEEEYPRHIAYYYIGSISANKIKLLGTLSFLNNYSVILNK